ncbi:MAG: dihydrolipoamide acetyltransferase family protein [Pseudomonadota bacterium]
MPVFTLPDLGEGLQEAEIVAWHVAAGEHVVADQPLASVETDKAVVEIPSPRSGRIAKLYGKPGERIRIGAPLVEFEGEGPRGTETMVGEIPSAEPPHPAPAAAPAPSAAAPRVSATPAVRALARELGVDLSAVAPTGPGGVVTKADVERAAASLAGAAGGFEPLRGVRRTMAINMTRAHAQVVPATVTDEADVDRWPATADVTARLVRAMVAACAGEPALNASYDGAAMARRLNAAVNLGIAVDSPDGLFVPVIKGAGALSPAGLERELKRLIEGVKNRSLPPAAFREATITLSNFGGIGGRHASLVVLPPQVAIVGAGRIAPRVVAVEGAPAVRRVMPLSLTFDHRAVTGGEAARFLGLLIRDFERRD